MNKKYMNKIPEFEEFSGMDDLSSAHNPFSPFPDIKP